MLKLAERQHWAVLLNLSSIMNAGGSWIKVVRKIRDRMAASLYHLWKISFNLQ
jgi:hypothetical protein